MGEEDESDTGSANLWSGPGKPGPAAFLDILRSVGVAATLPVMDARDEQNARDEQILFEALFEIRADVKDVLRLLEWEDEDEEEEP